MPDPESIQIARLEEQLRQARLDIAEAKVAQQRHQEETTRRFDSLGEKVQMVLDDMNQLRGGRKLLSLLIALGGIAGGVATWLIGHLQVRP